MLSELKAGERINQQIAVIQNISIRPTNNGKSMTSYIFRDSSGEVPGVEWAASGFKKGDTVHLTGFVGTYNGNLQIQVEKIEAATAEQTASALEALVPSSKLPESELKSMVDAALGQIKGNDELRLFTASFITAHEKLFYRAPGAKSVHHAWIGGLAEHSISVARIVSRVLPMYPWVNADIALAGALLHDIGKTAELTVSTTIDYGDMGKLHGHIYMGAQMVCEHAKTAPIDRAVLDSLIHVILSHHGDLEHGAVVRPATVEAELVHLADKMDASMLLVKGMIDADKGADGWTSFNYAAGRSMKKPDQPRREGV